MAESGVGYETTCVVRMGDKWACRILWDTVQAGVLRGCQVCLQVGACQFSFDALKPTRPQIAAWSVVLLLQAPLPGHTMQHTKTCQTCWPAACCCQPC